MSDNSLYTFKDLSKEKNLQKFQQPESSEYVAPALFQENFQQITEQETGIHGEIQEHMPPKLLSFTNTREYILKGFYTFKTSSGKEKRATRSPSKSYMKPVVDALADLDSFLAGDIPKTAEGKVDVKALDNASSYFLDTLKMCDKYLVKRKNPWTDEGKARYAMVSDLREKVAQESVRFSERLSDLKKNPDAMPEDGKWISILADIRTEKYEHGKDGVTISSDGGGTSDVIVIEKNGVTQYVKENENVPSGSPKDYIVSEMSRLKGEKKKHKGDDVYYYDNCFQTLRTLVNEIVDKCDNNVNQMIRNLVFYMQNNDLEGTPEEVNDYLRRNFSGIKTNQSVMKERYDGQKKEAEDLLGKMQKLRDDNKEDSPEYIELDKKRKELLRKMEQSDYLYLGRTFAKLKKDYTMRSLAMNNAQIADGENLTKRNVATKRMADMLKLSNLVVNTKNVELTVDGKTIKGISMEKAEGISQRELQYKAEDEGKTVTYSMNAYKQIMALQVLDVICGQVDRHTSNFLCDYKTDDAGNYVIEKITAIDNDLSFGNLTFEQLNQLSDMGGTPCKSIASQEQFNIPALDHETAQNILSIKPEELDYQMMDILSETERAALINRLTAVQRLIQSAIHMDDCNAYHNPTGSIPVIPKNEEQWKKNKAHYENEAKADIAEREKYVKIANDKTKSQEERQKARNKIKRTEYLDKTTYLMTEIMGGVYLK